MGKKGVSTIIITVLLVAFTLILVSIVWGVIDKILKEKLNEAGSCAGNFEELTFNRKYTCYNSSSDELRFSINRGDINLDEVIIYIETINEATKKIKLTKSPTNIPNLLNFPSKTPGVKMPEKNSGGTYIFNVSGSGLTTKTDSISLAQVISKNECPISNAIREIDYCRFFI